MEKPITQLNPYDVLLGRGAGSSQYIGNQRFRDVVEEKKAEYNSTGRREAKKQIAQDVLDRVQSLGGRFLRRDGSVKVDCSVEEDTWYVLDEKEALEKCKQTLREKRVPPLPPSMFVRAGEPLPASMLARAGEFFPPVFAANLPTVAPSSESFGGNGGIPAPLSSAIGSRTLNFWAMQSMLLGSSAPRVFDARPLPSARASATKAFSKTNQPLVKPSSASVLSQAQGSITQIPTAQLDLPSSVENPTTKVVGQVGALIDHSGDVNSTEKDYKNGDGAGVVASMPIEESSAAVEDDDVSEFLLSVLALSGRTKFTEHQVADEKASLTNEERVKVLFDLFGKYCSIRPSKKTRQDLDEDSVAFLVEEMRIEIERIPDHKKQALMEAQRVCRAEEFSDERLERFLRCVGMDVQLAAQRFVNYWQCRLEVFGPEKYLLSMTLSEALRDDLVALETGLYCLLPHLDASGRQVLYMDPSRHTREDYTSESLLRAIWCD